MKIFYSVVTLIFTFTVVHAADAITIDNFQSVQDITDSQVGGAIVSSSVISSTTIGGTRTFVTDKVAGVQSVELTAFDGGLYHSQGTGVKGRSTVIWDSTGNVDGTVNPVGLNSMDFLEDGSSSLRLKSVLFDFASNQAIGVIITVYDSRDPSRSSYLVTQRTLNRIYAFEDIIIPFTEFQVSSGAVVADFRHVGAVKLEIDGSLYPSVDFEMHGFDTNGICSQVPAIPGQDIVDDCGVCFGGNIDKDQCGVCFGNNAGMDRCGVCFGDGQSCISCGAVDRTETLIKMKQKAKDQQVTALFFLKKFERTNPALANKMKKSINAAYKNILTKIAAMNPIVSQCEISPFCVQSPINIDSVKGFSSNVQQLQQISLQLLNIKVQVGQGVCHGTKEECTRRQNEQIKGRKTFKSLVNKLAKENLALGSEVPQQISACS